MLGILKKASRDPLLIPQRLIYFEVHLKGGGGLIEKGGLFNLEKTLVSILHEELEYEVEKLMTSKRRLEVMQPKIKIRSELPVGK